MSWRSLSRKGSKGRKSWIKLYGLFVVELDANDSPLNASWVCRLCDAKGQAVFFAASATTSAADHLRKYVWRYFLYTTTRQLTDKEHIEFWEQPRRR